MENSIENAVDNRLEYISPLLYIFSVGLGITLIVYGAVILFKAKTSRKRNLGIICIVLGIIAIISGIIQMP